jgi:hypothetical protein
MYGNGTFVYTAANGFVGTSTDAITWTARSFNSSAFLLSCVFGNNTFVVAGNNGVLATTSQYTYNSASDFSLPSGVADINIPPTPTVYIKNG